MDKFLRPAVIVAFALGALLAPVLISAQESGQESMYSKATFAGGCFWCMEPPFDKLDGVISTTSGYAGGHVANPTYKQVSAGQTGHLESVQVVFDPEKISYRERGPEFR